MRWIRVVIPDIGWAAVGVACYAVLAGFEAFFLWQFGVRIAEFDRTQVIYLILAGVGFGVYRVVRFHPVLREDYLSWLQMTPWLRDRPPPLGPVHIVLQDIVVVGLLALLAWEADARGPAMVILGFAAGYLATLGVVFFQIRRMTALYALIFLLGLMIRVLPDVILSIGVGVVAYAAVVWQRFVGYPWTDDRHWTDSLRGPTGDRASELGWPFGRMGPEFVKTDYIPWRDALVFSLLFGWLTHVYLYVLLLLDPQLHAAMFIPYVMLLVGAFTRLVTYLPGYLPPISLLGRLLTGRLIIPSYDRVFVAPLCAVIAAALLNGFRPPGLSDEVFHPAVWATCLLILLGMGPQLKAWRLTGNHRITMIRGKLEQAG